MFFMDIMFKKTYLFYQIELSFTIRVKYSNCRRKVHSALDTSSTVGTHVMSVLMWEPYANFPFSTPSLHHYLWSKKIHSEISSTGQVAIPSYPQMWFALLGWSNFSQPTNVLLICQIVHPPPPHTPAFSPYIPPFSRSPLSLSLSLWHVLPEQESKWSGQKLPNLVCIQPLSTLYGMLYSYREMWIFMWIDWVSTSCVHYIHFT